MVSRAVLGLEVRILARRLYEALLLCGVGVQTGGIPGVSGFPPEALGSLGILLWSWRSPSTEWEGREAFCSGGAKEGVAQMAGRAEEHRGETFHR